MPLPTHRSYRFSIFAVTVSSHLRAILPGAPRKMPRYRMSGLVVLMSRPSSHPCGRSVESRSDPTLMPKVLGHEFSAPDPSS